MSELIRNIDLENTVKLWQLVLLLSFLIVGIYWEYLKRKPRTAYRAIALAVLFMSLYLISLSPYTLTEKPLRSALLLSQDLSESHKDSISRHYDMVVLEQQTSSKFSQLGSSKRLSLDELNFQIDTAFIYGYFSHLNPKHYKTRSDVKSRNGLRIVYGKSVVLGDTIKVEIINLENRTINIEAVIGQDTILKKILKKERVEIASIPKASGYVFCEISEGKTVYHFDVKVEEASKYVVQILSHSPDFEWKFLGQYLQEEEHIIFEKTKISKDKFKYSFYNWNDSLEINQGVAKDLKILFSDAFAWNSLPIRKQRLFLEKLKENEGSLLFRTNPNCQIKLGLDKSKTTNIFSTSDNLLKVSNYKYLEFSNLYGLGEVVKNRVFRKIHSDIIFGVLNFQNSYQLSLAGKKREYREIWEGIFQELVRKSSAVFLDKPDWLIQHQASFFRLWSTMKIEKVQVISPAKDTLIAKVKSDYLYPDRQHFMLYPKQVGWYFVQLPDREQLVPFYVHSKDNRNKTEFLTNYNQDYLNYLKFVKSNTLNSTKKYNRKSLTMWVFILFLSSAVYLWIEDKIA